MVEISVITNKIILLIVAIMCLALVLYIFLNPDFFHKMDIDVPKDKEILVRYYTCSLALCTRGCGSEEVKDICLYEKDIDTKECIENPNSEYKSCQDFCEVFGSSGKLCGKDYSLEVPIEREAYLKGCIKHKLVLPQDEEGQQTRHEYETELNDIAKRLESKGQLPALTGSGDVILDKLGCLSRSVFDFEPGILHTESDNKVEGIGAIVINEEGEDDAYNLFGCVESFGLCRGFSSCKFHGNLKIWSNYKKVSEFLVNYDCADVYATTSVETISEFDLNVEPTEQKIKIGDSAEFNVQIINDLGTEMKFTLSVDSYTSEPEGLDLGCEEEDCSENFETNSLEIGDGEWDETKLEFTPSEVGTYDIIIKADKSDFYDPELSLVTLHVVDVEFSLTPERIVTQPNTEQEFTLKITNNLAEDTEFDLSYNGVEECTCKDWTGNPIGTNSIFLGDGTSEERKIYCSSDQIGEYQISITATEKSGIILPRSLSSTLKVTSCVADGIKLSIIPGLVESGQEVVLRVYGLENCNGETVIFSIYENDPGFKIASCSVDSSGEECDTEEFIKLIANTPGEYEIYAMIEDMASSPPLDLKITLDSIKDIGYTDKEDSCTFDDRPAWSCSIGSLDICDYCRTTILGIPIGPGDCDCTSKCPDPQSCEGLTPSNLCCICGKNIYSNGPPGTPCLSMDDRTDQEKTNNLWFWNVDFPRDLLVSDPVYSKSFDRNHLSARIGKETCSGNENCNGGNGAPEELGTAECIIGINHCRLTKDFGYDTYYRGWEFIRITDDSRPVHGLQVEGWPDLRSPNNPCVGITEEFDDECEYYITQYECEDISGEFHPDIFCQWDGYDNTIDSRMDIYLHKINGEWIHIKTIQFEGLDKNKFIIRPPTGQNSWSNIDSILLTNVGTDEVEVDYLGLLTKNVDIPYCTDGNYDCSGVPSDCSHWESEGEFIWEREDNCEKAGCEWIQDCMGSPECDIYDSDKDSCEDVLNHLHPDFECAWFEDCTGVPKSCNKINFPIKTDCEYQGCEWIYETSVYNRIVEDGKNCYWNLDCPKNAVNGWEYTESTGVGAFGECSCEFDGGYCEDGYCTTRLALPEDDGRFLCYYNVVCAHGGWRNSLETEPSFDICESNEICDPEQGCIMP